MTRNRKKSGKPKLTPQRPDKVAAVFGSLGYEMTSSHGSHRVFNHPDKILNISIPFHNKELRVGLIRNLIKRAEITVEEYLDVLTNL